VNRGTRASTIGVGIAFGFLVTGSGFGNYTTIHQALLLRSWYLFAVFGSAVAVAAAGLVLLRRAGTTRYGGPLLLPHRPARRPHLYGAAIFGVGFGLTGTCPGGAVAMVATGGLGGLLVLAGLVSGMWLRGATARPAEVPHPEVVADRLPGQPRMHVRDAPSGHGGHDGFPALLVAEQPGGLGLTSRPEQDQHRISAVPARRP
jgi:uncharacterized protein